MAILSLTMKDSVSFTTAKRIELVPQVLLADYLAVCAAVCADLAAVSELQIIKAQLIIPVPGMPVGTVGENGFIGKGCTISGWIDEGNGKKASLKVPSPEAGFVNADGTILLTGDMATLLAHFEDMGDCFLSDGEDIESWIRGLVDK